MDAIDRVLNNLINTSWCAPGQHVLVEIVPTTKVGWRSYRCTKCPCKESVAVDPARSGLSAHKPHEMTPRK